MILPTWLVATLVLLALPTMVRLVLGFHRWTDRRGLRLLGLKEQYLPNHQRMERWCLLYVPIRTFRGCHSMSDL
jgi:hypothetical protein